MMVRLLIAAVVLWVSSLAVKAQEQSPPEGFRSLFNGKDFTGWHGMPHYDPRKLAAMKEEDRKAQLDAWLKDTLEHWRVENGEIVNDGKGPYLTTDAEFGDFELLIDYRTVAAADSGIYLRANPQVQIWDFTRAGGKWNRAADKGSGGLFNSPKRFPGQEPLVLADKPFGEWNRFRIRQVGARTDVWLNDQLVVDHAVMTNYYDPASPHFQRGPFQLQTHGGEIRWRNLFIREFTPEESNVILSRHDGFTPLFNGRDLTGWQGDVESYEVVDGSISCRAGKGGNLFTKDEYQDFSVRLEFKLPPGGNNGLAIRYPGQGQPHLEAMCEVQVLDDDHEQYAKLDPRQYCGSVYGMIAAKRGFLRPAGAWNYEEVTAQGSKIRVELNGFVIVDGDVSKVSEFKDNAVHPGRDRKSGFFGFAGHGDAVAFRNVAIKRLDPQIDLATRTWPQFRGHQSSGLATTAAALPTKIGPQEAVVWKTKLPPGHASPVVYEDRIYIAGVRGGKDDAKLVVIGMDRTTGKILWEKAVPHQKLEAIHSIGSHAQSTPATDGSLVVAFFGSSGLFCFDADGNEKWSIPMGPFNNEFGAGSSPVISGDRVVLVQDHDTDSFLMSIDKHTGKVLWKTDRSEFPRNYCSPQIVEINGRKQIVVAATLRVIGYDFETGKELWTVRGLSRAVTMTPVVGSDGTLFVAGWAQGGDEGTKISVPVFETALKLWDKNDNKGLDKDELEEGGDLGRRFGQIDRDKSNIITQSEYDYYRHLFESGRNVLMAIRPDGEGDLTEKAVLWENRKYLPFCASPLYAHDYIFTVKDGGIVTSINAKTGELLKTGRVPGTGNYYASPVEGDSKVFLADQRGHLTVLSSYAEWTPLHDVEFGEDIYATPAIVEGRIYLRTSGHLYCFGAK